jgi:hypothetical protein
MTDVLVIAVIVAFFVIGAVVVRLLDGMITHAGIDGDGDEETEVPPELGPGEAAR